MRVALYIRVSTDEQTADNQRPALEALARQRGWEIIETYAEQGSAWKNGHQPELKRLLAACRSNRNRPDIVLVWALDRLTRQGPAAILNLIHTFRAYGVKIISYQEGWTEAPGELEELLLVMIGWVAQQESRRRSERTKAGIERARATGAKIGKRGPDKKRRRKRAILKVPEG